MLFDLRTCVEWCPPNYQSYDGLCGPLCEVNQVPWYNDKECLNCSDLIRGASKCHFNP